MKSVKRINAKYIMDLRVRGEWELKRGILRALVGTGGHQEEFLIPIDTVVEVLNKSGVMFVAKKKRVHEHLSIEERV